MNQQVMWRSLDRSKFEHVHLATNAEGVWADGLIIHLEADASCRIRYRIQCDSMWQVQKVNLQRLDASGKQLILDTDGKGNWKSKAGGPIKALEGSRDIDIHFSPFTNTLPIRRLDLVQGESAETQVVFISVPDLSFEIARQQYTLIENNATGQWYEYESLTSGFKTKLPVDKTGLLVEYPQFFERIWPC